MLNISSLEFDMLLSRLTKAIIGKDKKGILQAYEDAKNFDLDRINDRLYKQYERLIDQGNKILGY